MENGTDSPMRKQCFALLTLLMVVIASLLNGVSAPATAQSATLAMLTPDNAAKIERLAQIDTEYTSGLFSWSPDGSQIAIGTSYQVKLYKTSDPQAAPRIFQYREKPANLSIDWFSITFSPDGTKMLVLGDEYQLWDVAGSTMQPMKDLPRHAHEFFSPDSKWLVTLDGESNPPKVQFWDTSTGKLITDFPSPDNHISAFALSHDQKLLAIVNWEQDHDFTLQLWDVGTRRELTSVTISKEPVTEVNFSPDGKVIAAIGTDGKLYLYRVPDLSEVARIPVSYVEKLFLAFHPARPVLATSDESGSGVTLYDIAKGVKFADLPDSSQPSGVFSPDGRWFSYSTYLEKEQNSPDGCIQI
jgi:WD40 repeat protein